MSKAALVRRLQGPIARAVLALPAPLIRRLIGRPIERDGFVLDPQVQLMLGLQARAKRPLFHEVGVARARREMETSCALLAPPPRALAQVQDYALRGPAGPIPARVYVPHGVTAPAPTLVYYHGGGFVLGGLDSHDPVCRQLADDGRCVVLAIDYRLAPEHPFPAAVDDALAAFRGVIDRADALGIDPARVAVGGDSAGGNLATVVALASRGDARPPCAQILIYPGVDMTMSAPSITALGRGFVLEEATIRWFVDHYLGAHDRRDPRASPCFDDLRGAAPALVITAGFDPLRDEGDAYARALADAGVAAQHHCFGPLFHGFISVGGAIHAAGPAMATISAAIRRLVVQ